MPSLTRLHSATPIPRSYMAKLRRSTGFRLVVGEEVEHSELQQSTEAEDKADGNVEIQGGDVRDAWEILP